MSGNAADLVLPRRWPLGEDPAEWKARRTCRTDVEVAAARRNVRETGWGRRELSKALAGAQRWLDMPDETLWALVLPTTVPRRHYVNQLRGCPVHGTEIKKRNHFHPWRLDPINRPWKVQCPVGEEWYPSNDFAKGETSGGDFADDGFAYRREDGEHFYFLGEYAERVHLGWVRPAVSSLSRAYLLTGDRRYARKAAIMLFRIAEEYGHMSYVIDDRARCDCGYPRVRPRTPLKRPNGNGWVGFFTDRIWENANVVLFARAYDDIFDALGDDTSDVLGFLHARRERALAGPLKAIYAHLSRFVVPRTMDEFRRFIEKHMLRVMAQGLLDRAISGNDGMHQEAMITLALVMGTPRTRELADWCYTGPGQMRFHLANYFFKDGSAYESLGGYNSIHIRGLNQVADKMERLRAWLPEVYPEDRYPRITEQRKHRLLYDFPIRLVMEGRYWPVVGDTGGPALPRRQGRIEVGADLAPQDYDPAFRLYGDPRYAQILASVDGGLPRPSLFSEPLDAAVAEALAGTQPRIRRRTDVMDGYGLAVLRSGEGDAQRALTVFYGTLRGHAHDDFLDIGLAGQGLYPVHCLGYPRSWHFSGKWEKNWVTHCRVGVAGNGANSKTKGAVRAVAAMPGLQYIDVEGMPLSTETLGIRTGEAKTYRRTCALIDLSPTDFYVVDIFRVAGGTEHYWAFHAFGEMTTQGLNPSAPEPGTLAGADVAYGEFAKIRDPAKQGFAFLEKTRRATPDGAWACEWRLGDERDTRLRFTMLPNQAIEALLTKGRSPSGGTPYDLDVILAARSGRAPLSSTFVTILELYAGGRRIVDEIETVPGGVRVRAGDRVDTILYEPTPGTDFDGEFGLWSERSGTPALVALVNGTVFARGGTAVRSAARTLSGTIVAVQREANGITVRGLDLALPRPGDFVLVGNAGRGGCYPVRGVEPRGTDVRLLLGDDALIGEGEATGFDAGVIRTATHFQLAGNRYYEGASLAAAGNTNERKLESVSRDGRVLLATPPVTSDELNTWIGIGGRFRIYDYGVGDEVRVTHVTCLQAKE